MVRGALAAACALVGVSACTTITDLATTSFQTNDFSGDPFPIVVQRTEGSVVVGVSPSEDGSHRTATLDVLSPFTVIDRGKDVAPSFSNMDLTILGQRGAAGALDLPRAKFLDRQVLTLHPCKDDVCVVGTDVAQRAIDAVLGMSLFASDALRLRLHDDQIFILPDIAGDDGARSAACDAVFVDPFRGGGSLIVAGASVDFPNRRVAIDACLDPKPERPGLLESGRGTDALLVLSTGIGPSLLGESAYERYRETHPLAPASAALPPRTVFLPSGPITGGVALIPSIALVSNWSSNPRPPCRQVTVNHLMTTQHCVIDDVECPCNTPDVFCPAPALVELKPVAQIEMIVVPDSDSTLQALRTELRPDRPEVDGILGASAIFDLELDIDPQHGRLFGRCSGDTTTCKARPQVPDSKAVAPAQACMGTDPGPVDN
jgi:hypothetical protein